MEVCEDNPNFQIDFITPASVFGYSLWQNDGDAYLCVLMRYGAERMEVDLFNGQNITTGVVDYVYDTSSNPWQDKIVRVSFGFRTTLENRCHYQGQVWAFKIHNECRDYASEPKYPFTVPDPTDPRNGPKVNGLEYNTGLSRIDQLVVPDKLYRVAQISVWKDRDRLSGLEFRFEVPSWYSGHAPVTLALGSTRLSNNFTIIDNGSFSKQWFYEFSTDPGGDGGLSKINFDYRLVVNITNGTSHNWGYLKTNLVGFKVTHGPSRDGTLQSIRSLQLLRDETSCEQAYMNYFDSLTLIQYEIGGELSAFN